MDILVKNTLLISLLHHFNTWVAPHVLFTICCFWDPGHYLLLRCVTARENFFAQLKNKVIWLGNMSLMPLSEIVGQKRVKLQNVSLNTQNLQGWLQCLDVCADLCVFYLTPVELASALSFEHTLWVYTFIKLFYVKPSLKDNNDSLDPCFKRFH